MTFRLAGVLAVGFAVLMAGCSDQVTQPREHAVPVIGLSLSQSEWTTWIQQLAPPSDTRGSALELFNDIKDAAPEDQQAAAMTLFDFMLDEYEAGNLSLPSPPKTGEGATLLEELLYFLSAVAAHYGVDFDMPDPEEIPPNVEFGIHVITAESFDDDDEEICIPTNAGVVNPGNAAVCLKRPALNLPTFLKIEQLVENGDYQFPPLPEGFVRIPAKVFDYELYNSIIPDGEGVSVTLCVPIHPHGVLKLFRDSGEPGAEAELKAPNTGVSYECPESHASLMKGDNLFARGVNAVSGFVFSALSPKRLYASHSLAHKTTLLSPWTLGELENNLTAKYVRTVPSPHTDTQATFKVQGSFVFWLEISNADAVMPCDGAPLSTVQARTVTDAGAEGTWTAAGLCEQVDVDGGTTPGFKFSLSNPSNNKAHEGNIEVRVQNVAADPPLRYKTER
jgi:hypothetical protein